MKYFILTYDVESTLIHKNAELLSVARNITDIGLNRVLRMLNDYDIRSTFYFTANYAVNQPNAVRIVKEHGHEIGCHGFSHKRERSFDLLNYKQQYNEIGEAKKTLEDIIGPITSFRSPELRINRYTIKALAESGFKTDSSISSQRFDGPLSLGLRHKIKWLTAPRTPYFLAYESPFRPGDSGILEIPISAAGFPFIGTAMRISSLSIKYLEKYLLWEAEKINKPIVFIFHPHECMSPTEIMRGVDDPITGYKGNFFSEVLRPYLKCRNLNSNSLQLLRAVIERAVDKGFEFITARDFYDIYLNNKK
jgi:peptidoglycan/xylan/chitin deacetylase (PgdA/CDA1 family)